MGQIADKYYNMTKPQREVFPDTLTMWDDAGFTDAVNAIHRIANALILIDINNGGRLAGAASADPEYIIKAFSGLNGAIRASLLKMADRSNAKARAELCAIYPLFNLILEGPIGQSILNVWINSVNEKIASPDGSAEYLDNIMQAFTKRNGEFVFEAAGDFDLGDGKGGGFKNTFARLFEEYDKQYARKRPDTPPLSPNPWECMIGGSRFYVPPVNISVSQNFKVSSLTGASIRQKASPKFNSGHSDTQISMTLYFPNQDQIWGIGAGDSLDIDFSTDDDYIIDTFMSSLRGLITQFKYAPFLPIKNSYINQAYGVTGVAMQSLNLSTVPDYPFCIAATLNMTSFNHKVFLPGIDDFSNSIHWGRYRQYIGKAAERMATDLYAGYKTETITEDSGALGSMGDAISNVIDGGGEASTYDDLVGYDGFKFKGFDRGKEIKDTTNLSLYYPKQTPLQVFAPDMSEWRSQGEDEIFIDDKNLWQQFLGSLGVDVNTNKDAQYETLVSSYVPNSKNFSPLSAFIDFSEAIKANIETIKVKDIEAYIERTKQKYREQHGSITTQIEDQIKFETYKDWLNSIYGNWKNTEFYKKYANISQKDNAAFLLKEWDLPMEKFTFDDNSVIIDGVSVGMSNTFTRLQIQMQDEPAYQHIGSGDSQVSISMTVLGAINITRFRELFSHINGLARLEHAHGVIGFLGIKNILVGLSNIKYVLPLNFQVDTVEGYPNVYKVRLDFVDFDVFQQRREELSSEQQIELIKNFGKRNPFLRFKQLWGATSMYPDLPLSIRDDDGNIVGHLEPDFYFKAFQTIDDETVNYLPSEEFRINPHDDIEDGSETYDQIAEALEATREIGNSYHLKSDGTIQQAVSEDEDLDLLEGITYAYAWRTVKYRYPDGAIIHYTVSSGEDGKVIQEPGEYHMGKTGLNHEFTYTVYDYNGAVTGFLTPDENGEHSLTGNPGVNEKGKIHLSNTAVYGKDFNFHIDQHFPVPGSVDNSVVTLRSDATGVQWGTSDLETGAFTPEMDRKVQLGEDNPSRSMPQEPAVTGNASWSQHTSEYDPEARNSYGQFEMMMKDTQYRNKAGRMVRAFPTYLLWLIDEGGHMAGVKLFDNFYGLSSVQDFSIHQSEDLLGDTLVLRVSNLYQKLSRPSEAYASLGQEGNPFKNPDGTGLIDLVYNRGRNIISGTTSDIDTIQLGSVRLKPGVRVHLRVGYGSQPSAIPTVFNGTITTVEEGDLVTITAQSDAVELSAMVNSTNAKGSSGDIDGAMLSNLWLSEPRDLMVTLLTQGVSSFRESAAHATKGFVFSENKYGIRHFGSVLYEALSDDEDAKSIRTKEKIGEAFINLSGGGDVDLSKNNDANVGYGAFTGASSIRDSTFSIIGQMWSNLLAPRDYEIFKRNIYPGNGTGVAQFLGGDLMDGGEMLAIAGLRPDRNAALAAASADETNGGVVPPLPEAIDAANVDGIADGSVDDSTPLLGQGSSGNWWDIGWSLVNDAMDDPLGAADAALQAGFVPYGIIRNRDRIKNNPLFKAFNLTGEVTDDDLAYFDEVSFRAQTYMKSVWDLFRVCANLLPNYIVAVRPFEDRSTVFYGKPHWLYTSGVIPLTTGIPKEYEMDMVQPDDTMSNLLKEASLKANPIEDFKSQYQDLSELASTSYAGANPRGNGPSGVTGEPLTGLPGKDGTLTAEQIVQLLYNAGWRDENIIIMAGITWRESKWQVSAYNPQTVRAQGNFKGGNACGLFQMLWPGHGFDKEKMLSDPNYAAAEAFKLYSSDPRTKNGFKDNGDGTWQFGHWNGGRGEQNYSVVEEGKQKARDAIARLGGTWPPQSGSTVKTEEDIEKLPEEEQFTTAEKERFEKEVERERDFGAFDDDIDVWYPKAFYKDQTKNVGHAARMLYDRDYFDRNNTDPNRFYAPLNDTGLENYGRTIKEANQVWDDLRLTYNDNDKNLADALFKIYFTKQHSAIFDSSDLSDSDFYKDAYEQKPTDPGSGFTGFAKRVIRKAGELNEDIINFTNPLPYDLDTENLWTDYTEDEYKIQKNMFYQYIDEIFGKGASEPTQADIERADEMLAEPELANYFKHYHYLLINFMRFLWYYSYNRAWVVVTADKRTDGSVIPKTDIDPWDNPLNNDGPKIMYEFDRIKKLWVEYLDEYDNNATLLTGLDFTAKKEIIYSPTLFEWMANNNEPGNDIQNTVEKFIDDTVGGTVRAIGEVITATSTAILGVVNLLRTQLMQLGIGMSMAGQMQRASNALNSIFNDSIYYTAGEEGSITRLADNPFTREYGEPVVEVREPFQRIHYIDSFGHILSNQIQENTSNVFTKITAVSDGNYPVTVHVDKGIPSNMQYETTIETGIYWDNPTGKGIFSTLHPLLHPIETAKAVVKASTGSSDEILSKRIGLAHLKESVKDIYGGELWVVGNPDIRPHDLVYLSDVYSRTYGMFSVEAVTHHFTPDMGFVTAIVPNAVVTINDPARWSLVSWIQGRLAIQTIRNDTRRLMQARNIENSLFAKSKDISLDELYQSLETQFKGTIQYTQGSSAVIRDMAALDHYGAAEYAEKQLEADIQGGVTDALILGGLNMSTLGLAGKAWDYVRDNLLDQQGLVIQYMTKDGIRMDAGLSYTQGVAVGQHHSKTLLPGILGLNVADVVDGHTRITKDDLLSQLGWSEIDVASVRQDVSWWVNKTNSNILNLSGKSPDKTGPNVHDVHMVRIVKVRDGDTIEVEGYGGDSWGDGKAIRMLGVASPELLQKDHDALYDDPFTIIDETTFNEVELNSADNKARLAEEYIKEILINRPVSEGRTPIAAIRINPDRPEDDFNRALGTIFHNIPTGVRPDDQANALYRLASKWPPIPWDSYMDDGRPYTANWSLISAGYANVDIGGISMMDYNNGGS